MKHLVFLGLSPEYCAMLIRFLICIVVSWIIIDRLYYRKSGKALCFVPFYVAPALRETHIGEPIRFDPDAPFDAERERIKTYLMDSITAIAESLPEHTVVPYRNIPRREYPKNRSEDKPEHEKACC